jgi:predicted ATPase
MIKRVHVKNYRGIGDVSVDLGPLTALVGRNSAGKSSFVDVLRFVRDAMTIGLDDAILQRQGIATLRRWAPTRPYDIEIGLSVQTRSFVAEYAFVIASGQEGNYRVKSERCVVSRPDRPAIRFERSGERWVTPPGELSRIRTRLDAANLVLPTLGIVSPLFNMLRGAFRTMSFYTIFPNTLREPQKPSPLKRLEDHGENLATAIRQLKKTTWFSDLIAGLNNVVGGVEDIRVQQAGGFLVTELKHAIKGDYHPWFNLSQESDGTLRMLGILVALYQNTSGSFIGIEEPELTLHPGALGLLSDVLHEASGRGQLLLTTQSPDLISRFTANELRVVEKVEGITEIGPIDEAQRETINEQLFSAGDLLRIEGLRRANGADTQVEDAENRAAG